MINGNYAPMPALLYQPSACNDVICKDSYNGMPQVLVHVTHASGDRYTVWASERTSGVNDQLKSDSWIRQRVFKTVKYREFHQLRDYQLLKKNFPAWS
jgi:hypothetical protein